MRLGVRRRTTFTPFFPEECDPGTGRRDPASIHLG